MKKYLIVIMLLLTIPFTIYAQDTDSENSEPGEETATDDIREAVKEKVKERIQNVTTKSVGIVGAVTQITETVLEMSTLNGEQTILTNEETTYQRIPGSRTVERSEIVLNQFAIVLGYISSDEEDPTASLIQLIEEPEIPEHYTVFGLITDINNSSIEIETLGQQSWTLSTSRGTEYTEKTDSNQLEDFTRSDLIEGDAVVAGGVIDEDNDNTIKAFNIHRVPLPETQIPATTSEEATQSAEEE